LLRSSSSYRRGSLPVPTFRHFHHKKSLKASFVAATGERLTCFTVWGLTSGQATLIDGKLSENERWDLPAFRAAVSRIMCEPPHRENEVSIEACGGSTSHHDARANHHLKRLMR
jgi:hypothetical protein